MMIGVILWLGFLGELFFLEIRLDVCKVSKLLDDKLRCWGLVAGWSL